MTVDALDLCLTIGRAHASLNLKLQENLGAFHGLDYEDFRLLHLLLADGGRMPMAELSRALGLPMSALLRKMVLLEKTGLAERTAGTNEDNRRHAAIRPGGRKLMQAAVTTVEAICADAVKSLDSESLPQIHAALLALCLDHTPNA
ncbi:MarR family winged helix-turn-helix transcriptional regulator [Variovorax sp. LT1R20]|uniref:MarR family winged helix-turn-helix transcriptional regulator n=1 Tax=Variovorax sp. LT1R20 TaxID=3443729 RepID=UPI003F449052